MLTAQESSELLKTMSPEERFAAVKDKVSAKTRKALEKKIRETIAGYGRDIEIALTSNICKDSDENIESLLAGLGYTNIEVTSDFPAYNEDYEGTTNIKFSIP